MERNGGVLVTNSHERDGLSSHWAKMLSDGTWQATELSQRAGLGTFIPRKLRRSLVHYLLQTPSADLAAHFPHSRRHLPPAGLQRRHTAGYSRTTVGIHATRSF
jgi:hypothetical protein